MAERDAMLAELKRTVLPHLRSAGFKGSFPHFRRSGPNGVDLVTFQFDRRGGGFVIELARGSISGVTTHWGQHIPPEKMKAWDIHPDHRHRLQSYPGGGTDSWFRFDTEPVATIAKDVLTKLRENGVWDRVEIGDCGPAKG